MAVNVELFRDLDAVDRDAAGALDRDRQPRLFDRLSWYRLVAEHMGTTPLVARARNGTATAWLFLEQQGNALRSLANWYSLHYGSAHIGSKEIQSNLLYQLSNNLKSFARIELGPIEQASPLPAAFRGAGWIVVVEPTTIRWEVDVAGESFEDYWARRPGKLRSTVKRKARAAGLEIAIHDCFDEAAWAQYEAVYNASWKPDEGAPAMLRALAEAEGAAGTLRLGIATKDGRPVAAQLWLVEGGRATIHKLAYVEDMKPLSPGTLLSHAMFRHAIDVDRVGLMDFGTGDDPYKRDWMERAVPLFRMIAHNPAKAAGLVGAAKARASALVRSLRSR